MKDSAAICAVPFLLGLEEKCSHLMMKKFGRLVDFEAVQAHSVNIRMEELEVQIMEKEYVHSQELQEWEVRRRAYVMMTC